MRIGIDVGILREKARGVGYYLVNLLENFSQISKDDSFYLYSARPILYDFSKGQNWHNHFGTIPLPGSFWLQTQGKHFIKKDQIDVLYAPAHVIPLKLPQKVRSVLAVHDLVSICYPETMANYNRFIHNIFFKSSIKNASHIITMSESTKQSIVDHFGIAPDKITVIYEGISTKFQRCDKNDIEPVLARHKLKNPYILSVGTLEPRKNYLVLLKAFKQLDNDIDLVIVGKKGWKSQEIFDTIDRLELHNRVKILGYVNDNDIPYLYNGAELFVFPSFYEGFGLPLLEAMACGVPVICSNTSSLPEIGGESVLYFNPNSSDELAYQIKVLISNNELKSILCSKGIVRAKQFSWEKTAKETLAVLKGLSIG
jgi:glycosyltransferase involved in cell wall biosynthesis